MTENHFRLIWRHHWYGIKRRKSKSFPLAVKFTSVFWAITVRAILTVLVGFITKLKLDFAVTLDEEFRFVGKIEVTAIGQSTV